MSKESRRPGREEIKELRKQRKKAAKALREKQQAQGLEVPIKAAMPNRKSEYGVWKKNRKLARRLSLNKLGSFDPSCRVLLKRLSKIKDPRNPKKIKHKHTAADDLRYPDFCFSNGLQTRSQQGNDPTYVRGEFEIAFS